MDRYAGRPFLRLVDAFVLEAIDSLSAEQKLALAKLEPQLQEAYKMPGKTWSEIVHGVMKFPPDIRQRVMGAWMKALQMAKKKGLSYTPEEFTVQFVDALTRK
jgi:hypothetical protein